MTGEELRAVCAKLLFAIGDGDDNPDFAWALREVAGYPIERLDALAKSKRLRDSMWGEIQSHLNSNFFVNDEEHFIQAVADLESRWG